jgi:hypothetical protein
MPMSPPVTLMAWISIFSAARLVAPTSRSGSRPVLVSTKKPPARSGVSNDRRAQGR